MGCDVADLVAHCSCAVFEIALDRAIGFLTEGIMTMQSKMSRRTVVKSGIVTCAFVPVLQLLPRQAAAADLPPLDPNDPTAKALGFTADTTKVDAGTNPTHQPTQRCGTCAQFQGKPGDARGGCNIFTGHSVPQGGWCKVWAQKPGA
jgi:hypothetical protein